LTAADILSRTHGSALWASYYGLFVAAVSIHASIGVRNILTEWSLLNDRSAGWCAILLGVVLALLGLHAVVALVFT
jgi:fumarate reductase subunit C